jgi:integrase
VIAPFCLCDLRHTAATRAAMSGIDLVTLASMLGHSKINMVMRYAHPTQEHQTSMECPNFLSPEVKLASPIQILVEQA